MMIVSVILVALGIYLAGGVVFAVPFVLGGVNRLDPHAKSGTWGFRVLIVPGTIFLWPLLLGRWLSGAKEPPTELNAHRCPAASDRQSGKPYSS